MNIEDITKKYLSESQQKFDLKFIRSVAKSYDISVSDKDAKSAHKHANDRAGNANDYVEELESYFSN